MAGDAMGLFDKMMDLGKAQMDSQERGDLPYEFRDVTEKALALLQVDRLDPERLAKLAHYDSDLLKAMSSCPHSKLPGTFAETEKLQEIAKDAYVVAIEADL